MKLKEIHEIIAKEQLLDKNITMEDILKKYPDIQSFLNKWNKAKDMITGR